jgi:tetratricopeptide (TPR) repeat protein
MPPVLPARLPADAAGAWWSRPWFFPAILVMAVALAYANSLGTPFLFDDLGAVQHNATIRQWRSALSPPADGSTTTGRPLVNLSFALNHALHGDNPRGYHALNVLIHAAAALLLFGVMRRTLGLMNGCVGRGLPPTPAPLSGIKPDLLAFFIALLWALHPLQTESVTCIAQRTESLCGLFYLAVFYGFVRSTSSGRWPWLLLSVLACLAGMATKEVAVTAPLLVLLYDRTFVAGSFAAAWRQRRGYYAALAATWLLLAWLVLGRGGSRGVAAGFGLGISWWEYLLQQCAALVMYLKLSVWPHPLVLDYGTAVAHSPAEVWWQGLVVLALLAGTGWALVRRPMLGFAGAWFFVILAPSSSVVPLVTQTMAEHRLYLPLVAVIALAVLAAWRWLGPRAWLPLGAAALLLAVLTVARNHDYRDALTIWTDTVAKCPLSGRAHVNLGVEVRKSGRPQEALAHFARAIALPGPSVISGHYHAGATLLELGDAPGAIAQLETAVQLAPGHADAHFTLANALVAAGRAGESLAHYGQALAIQPAADAHANLGVALAQLGRDDEALAQFTRALQLDPALPGPRRQYARGLARAGRPAEAADQYAEAVRLAPALAEVRNDFGVLLARLDRLPEAAAQLREAVRLQPGYADARANLGNVLLLQAQVPAAIEQYEQALRLNPGDRRTQENLQIAREQLGRGR